VIVPDEFLSIAIGKRGLNVRLASKLTQWHLDVISEELYSEALKAGYDSLLSLPGVGATMADALYDAGFQSIADLAEAPIEELIQIKGIGEDTARKLIDAAGQALAEEEEAEEMSEEESAEVTTQDDEATDTDGENG